MSGRQLPGEEVPASDGAARARVGGAICDAQEEEQERSDAREALHRPERASPRFDILCAHRGPHERMHREAARHVELPLERRGGGFGPPAPHALLDQRCRYHDQQGDGEQEGGEHHIQDEGAVDLRLEDALDRQKR